MKRLLVLASLVAMACGHTTYKPEVSGPKAALSKGGVVFPIPPTGAPDVKMKLVSQPTPKDQTLHLQMFFKRMTTDASKRASIDPHAQILILPDDGAQIRPSKVYANTAAKPYVDLSSADKQAIELVYQLPQGGDKYPYYSLRWAINYGAGRIETHTTRFDRDAKPSGNPDPLAPDFPWIDAYQSEYGPDWFGPAGWGWW